jgi:hypothetical protein
LIFSASVMIGIGTGLNTHTQAVYLNPADRASENSHALSFPAPRLQVFAGCKFFRFFEGAVFSAFFAHGAIFPQ